MTDAPRPTAGCPGDRPQNLITLFFRAVLAAAVVLAMMILILPGPDFLAFSNYLQILAAGAGSIAFLYCWSRCGHQEGYLWAACGLGLWGVANILWYVNVLLGFRALVFPSLIDLGMIASFFLLAAAFMKGFPERNIPLYIPAGIVVACLVVAAYVFINAGAGLPALVTLLYFLACGVFLAACIRYPGRENAELFLGAFFFALAFMIYPLREMFFADTAFLNIIGTMVSAGFSLIVTGWLSSDTAGQG